MNDKTEKTLRLFLGLRVTTVNSDSKSLTNYPKNNTNDTRGNYFGLQRNFGVAAHGITETAVYFGESD